MAGLQQTVSRKMPSGPQYTYLIAYLLNGSIDTVILKNIPNNTKTYGGTDLSLITQEVIKSLGIQVDPEESFKIIAITDLGMQ
ncbi:hypothetical protein D3C80_1298430 [compost metagenome]